MKKGIVLLKTVIVLLKRGVVFSFALTVTGLLLINLPCFSKVTDQQAKPLREEIFQEKIVQEGTQLLQKGTKLLQAGKYKQAIAVLEKIHERECCGTALYTNLGTAYFKTGAIGEAILCYERGLAIAPFNPELINNRAAVLNYAGLKNPYEEPFYQKISFRKVTDCALIVLVSALVICSLIYFLFAFKDRIYIGLIPDVPTRTKSFYKAIFVSCGLLCSILIVFHVFTNRNTYVIVMHKKVSSRVGPGNLANKAFECKEGEKIALTDIYGDWYKVERADGKRGWILKSFIEIIR